MCSRVRCEVTCLRDTAWMKLGHATGKWSQSQQQICRVNKKSQSPHLYLTETPREPNTCKPQTTEATLERKKAQNSSTKMLAMDKLLQKLLLQVIAAKGSSGCKVPFKLLFLFLVCRLQSPLRGSRAPMPRPPWKVNTQLVSASPPQFSKMCKNGIKAQFSLECWIMRIYELRHVCRSNSCSFAIIKHH